MGLFVPNPSPRAVTVGQVRSWPARGVHRRPLACLRVRGGRLSRPGARCQRYRWSVSPGRSPNPPCMSPCNGLSTVSVVRPWLSIVVLRPSRASFSSRSLVRTQMRITQWPPLLTTTRSPAQNRLPRPRTQPVQPIACRSGTTSACTSLPSIHRVRPDRVREIHEC
jgi:hypothetical protein